MYMLGGGINLMTIMMIFMAVRQSVTPLFQIQKIFAPFEGKGIGLLQFKLRFALLHSVGVLIVLYKFHKMGLLRAAAPTVMLPYLSSGFSGTLL